MTSCFTNPLRQKINEYYRYDEVECLNQLVEYARFSAEESRHITETAKQLVEVVRRERKGKSGLDAFLYTYNLSSEEGIALMCLAEALLRIPDSHTIDKLIRDKVTNADWESHLGKSDSFFVNASTWGLMLTGKLIKPSDERYHSLKKSLKRLIGRSSEPVIRTMVSSAVKILAKQFVIGRNIEEAMDRASDMEEMGYTFSYDMLGEAARTMADAERYFKAYSDSIHAIGKQVKHKNVNANPGVSVKLSALYPRYEFAHADRAIPFLRSRLLELCVLAKNYGISLTVDAEEADRLDMSLDILEEVFIDPALGDWEGLGFALQSYQKRGFYVVDWAIDLARSYKKRLMVRLIKGAYWDSEIKRTQELGLIDYPVFTRKVNTDVSYIACARKLLTATDYIYPMFASHNAHTVATILELTAKKNIAFEFQCLHGMGRALYDQMVGEKGRNIPVRIYAPVGGHEDLLAYLVRRLLENGANSSFVNRIIDEKIPLSELIEDPIAKAAVASNKRHPRISLPQNLYGAIRLNSLGIDLSNRDIAKAMVEYILEQEKTTWVAAPIVEGEVVRTGQSKPHYNPANTQAKVADVFEADLENVHRALESAESAYPAWAHQTVELRAQCLEKAANLLQMHMQEFIAYAILEAGKTYQDAIAEVREAIDFCRYYAATARTVLVGKELQGPTGEFNYWQPHGRGVIACISPWNFPLAIFIGQVVAALVAGNCVVAKPAEQTPMIAMRAIEILHEAGIPTACLHFLPGQGSVIGKALVDDLRVKGVIFTGSTETANLISLGLVKRGGPMVPFIAETGGQNAMIVDSTALPEQVVMDALISAFGSAGQRCSALRVLYLQEEVADRFINMIKGAIDELMLGQPKNLNVDIGPVIDEEARAMLQEHYKKMQQEAKFICEAKKSEQHLSGYYFTPTVFELDNIKQLTREVFGPILHIIRFKGSELDKVVNDINSTGYGLTLGIHSRIKETVEFICERANVGNIYVNRSMIGAVVGVQPFGGEALSGTGPKAGGPFYLTRLSSERTLSINTAAAGGNASLLSLNEQ